MNPKYEPQRFFQWLVLLIMLTGCIYFILKCGYKKPRVAASRNSTNLQWHPYLYDILNH